MKTTLIYAASIAAAGLGLAGCGLSGFTSGLGGGVFGGGSSPPTGDIRAVSEDQLVKAAKADGGASSEIGAVSPGCPRFQAGPRDNFVTVYEQGRVGDALAVTLRGEITKTARECSVEGGRVTVKYGFSGRVLLGPRGKEGKVSLPLSVVLTDAKRETVTGEKARADVTLSLDKPIAYFSVVKTVSFNVAEGARPGEYELFVGFERTIPNAG